MVCGCGFALKLTREEGGWLFDVRIEGEHLDRMLRMASDLLDVVGLKPVTTVFGTAGQRKTFEPVLNSALGKRSRSFTWKAVP